MADLTSLLSIHCDKTEAHQMIGFHHHLWGKECSQPALRGEDVSLPFGSCAGTLVEKKKATNFLDCRCL